MNRLKTGGSKDRFQHQWVFDPNGGAVREMFLLLGQMVKAGVVEKMKQANKFGLLTDEVCDIKFIKFVDVNLNQATTQFIATDDLLKDSSSSNFMELPPFLYMLKNF